MNILDRKSLFPEIERRGKRERSAIKKKTGDVNIAGRVAAGELAIDRHRVEVAGEADQFQGGHPGVRRCRAIAIPEKQHAALAGPVRGEASERLEIPCHLADPQLEAALVRQGIIQRELAAAAQKIGAALRIKIGQLEIASLQLQIRLQGSGRQAAQRQIPTADLEPTPAVGRLPRPLTLGAQAAGQTIPRRAEQSGQRPKVADLRIKIIVERHLAPSRRGRRDGDRAAQTNEIRLLPQMAFIQAHPAASHAESNRQFLDRILPPGKILGFEPQRNLSGQRFARIAVEGEFGQSNRALHLPFETREGRRPGQRKIEGVEGCLDARSIPSDVGKGVAAESP